MNERTLLALGLLLGVGSGKPPDEWLHSAHGYFRDQQAADPMNAAVFTVLVGAAAFYAAERGLRGLRLGSPSGEVAPLRLFEA